MDVPSPRRARVLVGCILVGIIAAIFECGRITMLCWLVAAILGAASVVITTHATTLVERPRGYQALVGLVLLVAIAGGMASTRFYVGGVDELADSALVLVVANLWLAVSAWRALVGPTARRAAEAGAFAMIGVPVAVCFHLATEVANGLGSAFDDDALAMQAAMPARADGALEIVLACTAAVAMLGALTCAAAHVWFQAGNLSAHALPRRSTVA